jgi:hypothetical protein
MPRLTVDAGRSLPAPLDCQQPHVPDQGAAGVDDALSSGQICAGPKRQSRTRGSRWRRCTRRFQRGLRRSLLPQRQAFRPCVSGNEAVTGSCG